MNETILTIGEVACYYNELKNLETGEFEALSERYNDSFEAMHAAQAAAEARKGTVEYTTFAILISGEFIALGRGTSYAWNK